MSDEPIEFTASLKNVHLKSKTVDGTAFPLLEVKLEQFRPHNMELLEELGKLQLENVIVTVTPKDRQLNMFEGSEVVEEEDEDDKSDDVDFTD